MNTTLDLECTSCGYAKTTYCFYKKKDKLRQPCKACINKGSSRWKLAHKLAVRNSRRKYYVDHRTCEISKATDYSRRKLYGVSSEQYTEMLHKQGWACAICEADYSEFTKGLHIDHDHKTGKVRGLLCHNCNTTVLRTVENYRNLIPKAELYLQRSI